MTPEAVEAITYENAPPEKKRRRNEGFGRDSVRGGPSGVVFSPKGAFLHGGDPRRRPARNPEVLGLDEKVFQRELGHVVRTLGVAPVRKAMLTLARLQDHTLPTNAYRQDQRRGVALS